MAKEGSIKPCTPSLFSMYRPIDVTLYDIIYGMRVVCTTVQQYIELIYRVNHSFDSEAVLFFSKLTNI